MAIILSIYTFVLGLAVWQEYEGGKEMGITPEADGNCH